MALGIEDNGDDFALPAYIPEPTQSRDFLDGQCSLDSQPAKHHPVENRSGTALGPSGSGRESGGSPKALTPDDPHLGNVEASPIRCEQSLYDATAHGPPRLGRPSTLVPESLWAQCTDRDVRLGPHAARSPSAYTPLAVQSVPRC